MPTPSPTPVDVELETLIRARYPIIYVVSWEERRVEETLREICQRRGKKMFQWTVTQGMAGNAASKDPLAALDHIMGAPDQSVFVLKDFHPFISDVAVTRRLRDLVYALKTSYKTLILLSPLLKLPPELEKEISVVDYQLPTLTDLDRLLEGILQSVRSNPQIKVEMTPLEREQVLKAASGLTSNEAENVFAKSLVEQRRFDIDVILSEKEQIIRKSGILEYYRASEAFADVGGLDLLKRWMQRRTVAFAEEARAYGLPEPKGVLMLGVQGCGKCFEKDTPILMIDGSVKAVQDVAAGDRVMGPDSLPRRVLSTTRGHGEMFRVTPTKGRPYTVNADHILTLRISGSRRNYYRQADAERIVNITVRDYLKQSASFKQRAMGYRTGVEFAAAPVPLDPYFLGVWLGDGSEKEVAVTTADEMVARHVTEIAAEHGLRIRCARKSNPSNRAATYFATAGNQGRTVNPLLDKLRLLGVWGYKHVPSLYLANSREVRLQLLAGIIDTDGHMAGNDYEVTQKRKRLAEDIAFLARSLGLAAYVSPCSKSCVVNGVRFTGAYYRIHISGDTDQIPVRIHYKRAAVRGQRKNVLNTGIRVESVGPGEYYGFAVDGDHRFLLGDFTVVHNSLAAKAIASVWHLPLLRLDVGKVFAGIVGSSEENMRKAISTAESVAPCVAGDTRITLADGSERTIESLFDSDETELEVLSMTEDWRIAPTRVRAVTRRAAPDLFTVRLRHSRLQATSNHLHPVLRQGELCWVRTDALQTSDYVAFPRHIPTDPTAPSMMDFLPPNTRLYANGALELARPEAQTPQRRYAARDRGADFVKREELAEGQESLSFTEVAKFALGRGGTADSTLPELPPTLSEDIGYLLGLIASDGFLSKRGSQIGFVNTDQSLHHRFAELLCRNFGVGSTTRLNICESKNTRLPGTSEQSVFKPCYTTYTNNRLLHTLLGNIEERLLALPFPFLNAWLRGYFDGDGCISDGKTADPKITLTAKRADRNRDVRSVLRRVGFPTTNPDCFNIEITGFGNVRRFIQQVGSWHPFRKARMESWLENAAPAQPKDRTDLIPIGNRLRRVRQSLGMGSQHFQHASSSLIHRYEHGLGHPNRERLRALAEEMRVWTEQHGGETAEIQAIAMLVDSPVAWSRVLAVTPEAAPDYVYDLVCENPHTFIANGVVTHNCVLWIDELEKGFAGTQSSPFSDGGTTSRVFSTFITWLQEKQASCFVVATSNDVSQLPPELMRKGRFDEIFFVDLPAEEERGEIFAIHLRKRKRDPKNYDLDALAGQTVGYSGAEIEQVVVSSLYDSFGDNKRELTTDDLLRTVRESVPLSVTMREGIARLREWAETRARPASSQEAETTEEIAALDPYPAAIRRDDDAEDPVEARLEALERKTATGLDSVMHATQNAGATIPPAPPVVEAEGTGDTANAAPSDDDGPTAPPPA